jgi:very-short-patch-repair endonuclease
LSAARSVGNISRVSPIEAMLGLHIRTAGLPAPTPEYVFHPSRKWRFDFAWPDRRLAVECEGGVFTGGRHTRGGGFTKDCEKYNAAALLGWKVLRFTAAMIKNGSAIQQIERAFT